MALVKREQIELITELMPEWMYESARTMRYHARILNDSNCSAPRNLMRARRACVCVFVGLVLAFHGNMCMQGTMLWFSEPACFARTARLACDIAYDVRARSLPLYL